MIKVRVVFEKKGRSKYISHLDLNRCMQRTFRRSGLPVWYTEGFNPHIYIMFALPLSLGYESSVEVMDFNLTEEIPFDEIVKRLNYVMPEGIRVLRAYSPVHKHTAIKSAEYKICFKSICPDSIGNIFRKFMTKEQLNTIKKTKKGGQKLIDLKPDVKILSTEAHKDELEVRLIMPAGSEKNLNPSLLIEMFTKYCASANYFTVERTGIYMDSGKSFA